MTGTAMILKTARTLALALLAFAVALPAAANAATARTSSVPTVSNVAPLNIAIGDQLTITGRNFRAGKGKNTVVFKRDGQRAVFVTAEQATATQIKLTIPAKLTEYLSRQKGGTARPTRFRLRVLSARFGRAFTATKLSPVVSEALAAATTPTTGGTAKTVTPTVVRDTSGAQVTVPVNTDPDCDADGLRNSVDTDDDNDLLPDTLEATLKTDACNADSDGDGMADGWEYQSARQLNRFSCPSTAFPTPCDAAQPYPRKRPFPNPLDGSDSSADYDRDSLRSIEEYTAWARHPGHSLTDAGMWYSDGLQASQDNDPADGCRGIAAYDLTMPVDLGFTLPIGVTWTMPSAYKRSLDLNGDGCLTDEERDEDGDLLTNYDELSGRMVPGYWKAKYAEEIGGTPHENGLDWLDPDSDGDGTVDGIDDQDFDDYLNIEELTRGIRSVSETVDVPQLNPDGTPVRNANGDPIVDKVPKYPVGTTGLWVNPFSPCYPDTNSKNCDRVRPINQEWTIEDPKAKNQWPVPSGPQPPSHLIPRPY
jgi:hypothetical protein